ncbi:GNAT family N-acetyltransferase [Salinibacillus xinjiangensis]|uniref:GNAT family N-acetyltransferase n=1 Tax=Salinibacillus xinjiangensis TaxID=1229268 RepID=A0A6G1X8F8_9BACI|nr:GNAT family protein [Salinibacillus xinjiangensis]MRG87160.1 GNAT family N-acetyltransferase [Salinibacillus xinjiangensis]
MEFPTLETDRLALVRMTNHYLHSYYDIMSRDEVTKYYSMESLKSVEDAENIISSMKTTFESGRGIRWGIVLNDKDKFVGTIGLNHLNTYSKKAEVGFEIHPEFWNEGITSEAVSEVLRYSFEELGLFRMGAVTYPQNKTSIHVLKKFGFSKEGVLRGYIYQNQQSHDACVFSLLRSEWSSK